MKKINYKEILNKRAEDLTEEEADLLKRLSLRRVANVFKTSALLWAGLFLALIPVASEQIFAFLMLELISTGFFVFAVEVSLSYDPNFSAYLERKGFLFKLFAPFSYRYSSLFSLKSLGLTRKEYRELKKMDGIWKAQQLVQEYENLASTKRYGNINGRTTNQIHMKSIKKSSIEAIDKIDAHTSYANDPIFRQKDRRVEYTSKQQNTDDEELNTENNDVSNL